ncbi:S-layer homology domain-containing protein [Paenibacillus amylolyticus]|nr:S-layer homology domain-containing protein [Paenibacillus amylolyticus]
MKDTAGHWAKSAIDRALAAGFVNGYGDDTFRPNQKVTRAEFITMLGRALNLNNVSNNVQYTDENKIPAWSKTVHCSSCIPGHCQWLRQWFFRAR